MFGVIPRMMWEKLIPPDENNLIPMVTNIFVLKAHGKNIIFDAGLGDTLSEREKKIYNTDNISMMDAGLAESGLTTNDIDYVILTHLHTDHAAGAVKFEDDKYVPRFPKAKIIVGKEEWEDAINPNERTSAVYIPERFYALQNANQVELIELDKEILPGIKAVRTGGHTGGHFALEIESDNQSLYYYADIFPSSAHIRVPFIPATDLYPLDTMAVKRQKLPEIIKNEVIMAFDHDINIPLGVVKQDGKKIFVESV